MDKPLISVIIPSYNNEATLGVAVESILKQTYKNLEVIIVDDSSTDGTRAIAEKYAAQDARVRVIQAIEDPYRFDTRLNRNINAGWSARNAGLAVARGEYITFQDGDDASLLNRIEVQYELLKKYNATHVTIDWFMFDEKYLNKRLDTEKYRQNQSVRIYEPAELSTLAHKTKGFIPWLFPSLNHAIPFHLKRKRVIHRLFFGSLASYLGAGNSPLFTRAVIDRVQFRRLADRVWPSFMGRGADRDFNFQVAETFKNSYVFSIPLYLWRVKTPNGQHASEDIPSYFI